MVKTSRAAQVRHNSARFNTWKKVQKHYILHTGSFEIFLAFDRNGDHKISQEEFDAVTSRFEMGEHEHLTKTIFSQFFSYADVDSTLLHAYM